MPSFSARAFCTRGRAKDLQHPVFFSFVALRKKYVEVKEKEIDFASGVKWSDVEADETTFDRQNMGAFAENKAAPIAWEQWCGLVKRGHPESLVLHRLSPKMSEARAPGPGAIRKVEWPTSGSKTRTWFYIRMLRSPTSVRSRALCTTTSCIARRKSRSMGSGNGRRQTMFALSHTKCRVRRVFFAASRNSSDRSCLAIPQGSCPNQSGVPCRKCCTASQAPVGAV